MKSNQPIKKAIEHRETKAVVDEDMLTQYLYNIWFTLPSRVYCSHRLALLNETGIPFITSDNPVGLLYTEKNTQSATIFVPLSQHWGYFIKPNYSIAKPTLRTSNAMTILVMIYAHPEQAFVAMLNELTAGVLKISYFIFIRGRMGAIIGRRK